MGSKRVPRPRLAIALLGLCALAGLRIVWSIVGELRQPPESNSVEAVIARFEPLRRLLPEGVVTGFVVDERHADVTLVPAAERFRLAQYALSPRLVEDSPDHALVVVDADVPTTPEVARARGWTLVADLHNGVRLFRTDATR